MGFERISLAEHNKMHSTKAWKSDLIKPFYYKPSEKIKSHLNFNNKFHKKFAFPGLLVYNYDDYVNHYNQPKLTTSNFFNSSLKMHIENIKNLELNNIKLINKYWIKYLENSQILIERTKNNLNKRYKYRLGISELESDCEDWLDMMEPLTTTHENFDSYFGKMITFPVSLVSGILGIAPVLYITGSAYLKYWLHWLISTPSELLKGYGPYSLAKSAGYYNQALMYPNFKYNLSGISAINPSNELSIIESMKDNLNKIPYSRYYFASKNIESLSHLEEIPKNIKEFTITHIKMPDSKFTQQSDFWGKSKNVKETYLNVADTILYNHQDWNMVYTHRCNELPNLQRSLRLKNEKYANPSSPILSEKNFYELKLGLNMLYYKRIGRDAWMTWKIRKRVFNPAHKNGLSSMFNHSMLKFSENKNLCYEISPYKKITGIKKINHLGYIQQVGPEKYTYKSHFNEVPSIVTDPSKVNYKNTDYKFIDELFFKNGPNPHYNVINHKNRNVGYDLAKNTLICVNWQDKSYPINYPTGAPLSYK